MSLTTLEIFNQISVLKDMDYKNTLAISVLVELSIEKNIFTRKEFIEKASELEKFYTNGNSPHDARKKALKRGYP